MKMKLMVLMLAVQLLKGSFCYPYQMRITAAIAKLTSRIEEVKTMCEGITGSTGKKVAFSAALQPTTTQSYGYGKIGPFSSNSTLIHGHIITNIGEAYNPNTGVFTAPVKGVYFFTFTTMSWVAKANIGVSLYRNNEEVLLIWEWQDAGDNEDYATNSVNLALEPGDTVYLSLPSGFQVASSKYSNIHTFSGFLLFQQ